HGLGVCGRRVCDRVNRHLGLAVPPIASDQAAAHDPVPPQSLITTPWAIASSTSSASPRRSRDTVSRAYPVRIQYAVALNLWVSLGVVSYSECAGRSHRYRTRLMSVLGPPSVSLKPQVAAADCESLLDV